MVEEDRVGAQTHQAVVAAITSTAAMAAVIGATTLRLRRGRAIGAPDVGSSARVSGPNAKNPHRPRDVLDALFAQILERVVQLVSDLVSHHSGDADPARFGQRFQPRRYIHSVAGVLYGAASVLLDLWINQLREMRFEAFVSSFLIRSHQSRVAGDIGGEDCSETADRGHGLSV